MENDTKELLRLILQIAGVVVLFPPVPALEAGGVLL